MDARAAVAVACGYRPGVCTQTSWLPRASLSAELHKLYFLLKLVTRHASSTMPVQFKVAKQAAWAETRLLKVF